MEKWNNKISDFLHKERAKMQGLTPMQKVRYIIDYYWLWILGTVCVVSLAGYMVYRANFAVKDYWFYAMFANTSEDGGNNSLLWRDFVGFAGVDIREKKVEMNSLSFFDPSVPGGTNNSYYQAFVALVESGDLDVVVMGREGLRGIGSSGRLLDLNDERCRSIAEAYGDRLVECTPYDEDYSDQPVPVGIDISDSLLVTKYHLYPKDCVLGISAYSSRLDYVETFLEFLFQDEAGVLMT